MEKNYYYCTELSLPIMSLVYTYFTWNFFFFYFKDKRGQTM
jgi:hypothetical protein